MKKKVILIIPVLLILSFITGLLLTLKHKPAKRSENDIHHVYKIPVEIEAILRNSCYDCHSDESSYPWYGRFFPVNMVIDYDIRKGKESLNFSDWIKLDETEQLLKLSRICGMAGSGRMPYWKYTIIHRDALLSQEDRVLMCKWVGECSLIQP